jgi:hypothetical protein
MIPLIPYYTPDHCEVVNPHDLAAEEPKKYYDPWAERD